VKQQPLPGRQADDFRKHKAWRQQTPLGPASVTVDHTVADGLADFICTRQRIGLDEWQAHETKRLLLNQLKASAEAARQPAGGRLLARAAQDAKALRPAPAGAAAHLWWSGTASSPAHAAAVNQQLLKLLDFGDTHLPSLGSCTAALLPSLLAEAEVGGQEGALFLQALATGLEVELACAMLAPAPQDRPAAQLSLGAAAARCTLRGLGREASAAVLNEARPTWLSAPGALAELVEGLGRRWRLQDIALHCRPLPVHALAPIDAVLALRPGGAGQRPLQRLQLTLSPQALRLAQDAEAAGESALRHAMATAWRLGQFTADELPPAGRGNAELQALQAQIELLGDAGIAGLQACALSAQFADGSSQSCAVDAFLGAPAQPLSDSQLSELFRSAADDVVLPHRAGEILHALWGLDQAADVRGLVALLRKP